MGFHHVALATPDLARTHAFYTEAMGFELAKVVGRRHPRGRLGQARLLRHRRRRHDRLLGAARRLPGGRRRHVGRGRPARLGQPPGLPGPATRSTSRWPRSAGRGSASTCSSSTTASAARSTPTTSTAPWWSGASTPTARRRRPSAGRRGPAPGRPRDGAGPRPATFHQADKSSGLPGST